MRLYNIKAIHDQIDDEGDVIQNHDYGPIKDNPIGEIDWLEEEKTEFEQITAPVLQDTKLWIKHKIWELDNRGMQ